MVGLVGGEWGLCVRVWEWWVRLVGSGDSVLECGNGGFGWWGVGTQCQSVGMVGAVGGEWGLCVRVWEWWVWLVGSGDSVLECGNGGCGWWGVGTLC